MTNQTPDGTPVGGKDETPTGVLHTQEGGEAKDSFKAWIGKKSDRQWAIFWGFFLFWALWSFTIHHDMLVFLAQVTVVPSVILYALFVIDTKV